MGGLHVASGWLTLILLALFVTASRWFTQILLALFVLCYSQWVAYVDFIGIFCDSQWVACAVPFSFTCFASGWPVCSQWAVYAVSFGLLIFPVLDRSVSGQRLARSQPHPRFVCFLVGTN